MPDIKTRIATADAATVTIRGMDIAKDLIGKRSFTEMFYFLTTGRMPSAEEVKVLDACLVAMMEHGFTPSALIARFAAEGAPDQIQIALGAGLLAVGDVHAGTMEACAALLHEGISQDDKDAWCRRTVAEHRARREAVPGFGHRLHKPVDPRTPPLLEVAREARLDGPYVQLLLRLSTVIDDSAGRHITINATGALAALLLEIGIPREVVRGIAVVSRCAGLVGHVLEEHQTASSRHLVRLARETIPYEQPEP
ncbi:MAG: citryl-CoA lyase [Beijerinckiaceae bacterium]